MRSLFLLAAVMALALAKPGTYRETEDFQFERSATGEGTKAGFYGAQRGNVGGNFERAHNMDGLAQKQMSDAVRNVQGDLRDTNHVGVGNVYTVANTRGTYGQKHSNTGNLEGRTFQKGSSFGSNSQTSGSQYNSRNAAHSSLQNTDQFSPHNADFRKGHSSYQQNAKTNAFGSEGSRQTLQADNHEASNRQQGYDVRGQGGESNPYTGSDYKGQGAYDYSHKSRSQNQREEQSAYGSNIETRFVGGAQRTENAYGSTAQSRLDGGGPIRISIRPGSTITVPVRVELDNSNRRFDANTINTDTEVLGKPGMGQKSNSKNYESSYRYNKAWEKHDSNPEAVPLAIPTARPYPESYALTGTHDKNAAVAQYGGGATKTHHNGYNAASGSQSRYEPGFNTRDQKKYFGTHSNAYTNSQNHLGSNGAVSNVDIGTQDSTPEKYQSKYSYHKSWERQGDPYVIVPASGNNADSQSQSLLNPQQQGYRSQHYDSHASHAGYAKTGHVEECDEDGHSRIKRSDPLQKHQEVDTYHQQYQYEGQVLEQQQVELSSLEDLGQQIQTQHDFDTLESFSHQSESKWVKPDTLQKPSPGALTHIVQNDKKEDLDQQQQVQTSWDNLGQQTENRWDNLENLGQQTKKVENFGQQLENQWSNSENLEQQTQDFDNLGQQTVNLDTLRPSGHQNGWHKLHTGSGLNLESFSHQSENKWVKPDNLQKPSSGVQTQSVQQGKLEDLNQQQQVQTSWDNLGQQMENKWDNLENRGQQTQKLENFGQQVENQWSNSENVGQQTQDLDNLGQQTVNLDTIRTSGHQNGWHTLNTGSGHQWKWKSTVDSDSHVTAKTDEASNHSGHDTLGRDTGSSSNRGVSMQSLWDKIDNMEQGTLSSDSSQNRNVSSGNDNQSGQNMQGSNNNQFSNGASNYHYQQSSHSWQSNLGTTQTSNSHYETSDYRPWHSSGDHTTEKIKFDLRTNVEVKPSDAGRGDIGTEDGGTTVESKKPLIFTSQFKPTDAKAIEGLSLTAENITHNIHKVNKADKDNTESMGVLSLEQQGRHGQTNLKQSRNSTSNLHISHNRTERTENSNHVYSSANNQQDETQAQTSWSQHGNGQWQEQNMGQQLEDLGQQAESDWFKHTTQLEVNDTHTGQQNTQQQRHHAGENLEDLGQQVITDWSNLEPQSQHTQDTQQRSNSRESLADFGQHKETGWKPAKPLGKQTSQAGYSHHQTQSTPKTIHTGENLEDLGQQVQTDWAQDENLQQQSQLTQQTSDLGSLTEQGSDDFYKQRYHEKPQERGQLNVEQAVPAKVEEVTTQKPGFWKKVSTKVNGWFGKS